MKKNFVFHCAVLALCLLLLGGSLPHPARAEGAPPVLHTTAAKEDIQKYGNLVLALGREELLSAGYRYGDVVTVAFLDSVLELPLCSSYSDVDAGEAGLFARDEDSRVKLAVNMGDFASSYHIAIRSTGEDKSASWQYAENVAWPVEITISLKEAGGYYGMYLARHLVYSDSREDYPQLSDAQFANFREAEASGLAKGRLFRTASPVDPEHNRSSYADEALREAGVTVIMNCADDEETLAGYPGYAESYYATAEHIALNMSLDFQSEEFRAKLADGLRFFAAHKGVYAVHCTEGKDRAGLVSALLECLVGAEADEVVADYMLSYYNYYGVEPGSDRYDVIADGNIVKTLCRCFHLEELSQADLGSCAQQYLLEIGLTDAEISALRENLSA